jgi:hypothetical protein
MRTIDDHKVNPTNDLLTINVVDAQAVRATSTKWRSTPRRCQAYQR